MTRKLMFLTTFLPYVFICIGLDLLDGVVLDLEGLAYELAPTLPIYKLLLSFSEFVFDVSKFMDNSFVDAYWPEELTSEVSDES